MTTRPATSNWRRTRLSTGITAGRTGRSRRPAAGSFPGSRVLPDPSSDAGSQGRVLTVRRGGPTDVLTPPVLESSEFGDPSVEIPVLLEELLLSFVFTGARTSVGRVLSGVGRKDGEVTARTQVPTGFRDGWGRAERVPDGCGNRSRGRAGSDRGGECRRTGARRDGVRREARAVGLDGVEYRGYLPLEEAQPVVCAHVHRVEGEGGAEETVVEGLEPALPGVVQPALLVVLRPLPAPGPTRPRCPRPAGFVPHPSVSVQVLTEPVQPHLHPVSPAFPVVQEAVSDQSQRFGGQVQRLGHHPDDPLHLRHPHPVVCRRLAVPVNREVHCLP